MRYLDVNGENGFHVSEEKLSVKMYAMFFSKAALYQESMNIILMRMWEVGVMQRINNDIDYTFLLEDLNRARSLNKQGSTPPSGNVELRHLTGGFLVIGIGSGLACLSFMVEQIKRIYNKFNTKKH